MSVVNAIGTTAQLLSAHDRQGVAEAHEVLTSSYCWDDACTSAARGLLLVHTVVLQGTTCTSVVPSLLTDRPVVELFHRTVLGGDTRERLVVTGPRFGTPQAILKARQQEIMYAVWLFQTGRWSAGADVRRAPMALGTNGADWCSDAGEVSTELVPVMRTLLRDGIAPHVLRRTAELL